MFRLNNETQIPEIGLGVYKMEAGKEMNDAVKYAYQSGYRLYDTAQMYKNEQALGDALKENKIPREDIFLISKVNNCNQGYEKTISSFKESLQKLQTEYLDAFLVHWPGQDKARMLDTWKAMEHLYKKGKVKSIGVCNFEISQLTYLLEHCEIKPMIAMPFHPSNTYTIDELKANLDDILADVEKRAQVSLDGKVPFTLRDKVVDGKLYVEQGIIAGCAGGGFENICAAADILKGKNIGHDAFTLSVYPASTPIYMELAKNGVLAELIGTGAVVKTAFCGPCFGAGDTPANNAFSIRHTTRNFPNREGSKIQNGQISSVALMDARSIAATAANKGFLTSAEEFDGSYSEHKYYFDKSIYENRVFDSKGVADPSVEIQFGPNIKDWPEMAALADNLILKVVSEIHDPVTTTDELIPSGETSSYRSNPLGLAEFTLSRKDPEYVGRAKAIQAAQKAIQAGNCPAEAVPELKPVIQTINKTYPDVDKTNLGVGSTIFAVKPGDGSAREQAASCQKVLGGWANIANEYATKRYRSNLINWGMLPFLIPAGDLPFKNGDFLFFPGIRKAVEEKADVIKGYTVDGDTLKEFEVTLGELTDDEREIILKGCLINYNRK